MSLGDVEMITNGHFTSIGMGSQKKAIQLEGIYYTHHHIE